MSKKQILLDVKVNLKEAITNIAEYQVELESVVEAEKQHKATIKEMEAAIAEKSRNGVQATEAELKALQDERTALVMAQERRKALNKEIGEQSRMVQNTIIAEEKYKGTLKGLCAQLSVAKDQLRAMAITDPGYEQKVKEVDELNERIKEMEASYGVYTRNVGNYGMAVESTTDDIHAATQALIQLTAEGKENSEEFAQAQAVLHGFANELAQNNQNSLEFCSGGLNAVMGAMSVYTMVMGANSEEAKKMQSIMQKLQIATMALSIATQLYQALQKKGIVQKIAENLQVKAGVAATVLETKAKASATGATVAQTVAQKALNAVMNANPIFLIISGVIALGAALVGLVSWLMNSSDAQDKANKAQAAYDEALRKSENSLAALEAKEKARATTLAANHQRELMSMMQSGATKEQIEKKKQEYEEQSLKETAKNAKERQKIEGQLKAQALENYEAQKAYLDELIRKKGKDAEKTKEQQAAVDEAYKAYIQHVNNLNDAIASENQAYYQQVENRYNAAQSASDKAYERERANLEKLEKVRQEKYKQAFMYLEDFRKSDHENGYERWQNSMKMEKNLFLEQQRMAKAKLDQDLKFGKITRAQHKEQLEVLAAEEATFYKGQQLAAVEFGRKLLEDAINLAGGKTMQAMITDTQKEFEFARERINASQILSEEEKSFYIQQLNEQEAQAIKDIQLKEKDDTIKKIQAMVEDSYRYDERQYSASEIEKTELAIEQQKKLISEKKKQGLNTYADEVKLAQLEYDLRVHNANKELQLKWKNADEQLKIQKEFLQKELAMANLSAEQRAALEQELAEITVEASQRKIAAIEEYSSYAMDLASSVSELMTQLEDSQVAKAEESNNKQKTSLDKQLRAGLISQKQYDKEVAKLDEELDAKKAKIARQQAIREKALSVFHIGLNTAMAIMKIWAEVPKVDFGASTIALTAMVAALGAVQLATALAAPIPQARYGGLVKGATHEAGGVLIEAENDERIISAKPSRAFPELLNLISYIGKHGGIPETGYAARSMTGYSGEGKGMEPIDYDLLADKVGGRISEALQNLKIYTAIKEVREADELYTMIEENSKL
ncbi:MAG: hypothetical protein IJD91_07980 [Clostridia bacterium]|nr:hypothetical protein [Clostridia bacterium]